MNLYYFRDPSGNFGDDLNPWLWPKIAPRLLTERKEEVLVGIGTLLNHRLPPLPHKHILGSGVGYGDLPVLDESFTFHAVRGFGSARALGLSPELAIIDPGVLVRCIPDLPRRSSTTHVALMLTGQTLANFNWIEVCNRAGIQLISCHWDVDRVLSAIRGCGTLLTEAMHGAIVADSLRTPWIPVTCNENILAFKWLDWLSTLDVPYEPTRITPLYDVDRHLSASKKLRNHVHRAMAGAGVWRDAWSAPPQRRSTRQDIDRAIRELVACAKRRPFLSEEATLQGRIDRLLACIARVEDATA